ncbi:MAG TPA: ribonuclease HII [Thermaerobacter sp.]
MAGRAPVPPDRWESAGTAHPGRDGPDGPAAGVGDGQRLPLAELEERVALAAPDQLPAWIRALEVDPRVGARRLAARARRRWERWRAARARWAQLAEAQRERAGGVLVAGVDEVGRGCLAGPVVAAAVILPDHAFLPGLDDSKRLSPAAREELAAAIREQALDWAVGVATPAEVDALNVAAATRLAMRRALDRLRIAPEQVLVDGRPPGELGYPVEALVDGDARFAAIAAASVLAKVFRDAWMRRLDPLYPPYGFARNKGYATADHRRALIRHGPCPEHRRRFLAGLGDADPKGPQAVTGPDGGRGNAAPRASLALGGRQRSGRGAGPGGSVGPGDRRGDGHAP